MVFREASGGLSCHRSGIPCSSILPRLCAKHSRAGKNRGVAWEADPRHAELIRKSNGVTDRSDATPGIRDKADDIEGEDPISMEAADRYRANTMHHAFTVSLY